MINCLPEGNNAIRTDVLSLLLQVKKKRPGRDGKMAGLVPVLYVNQSWFQWCEIWPESSFVSCSCDSIDTSRHHDMPCEVFSLSVVYLSPPSTRPHPPFSSAEPPWCINWFCSWLLQLVCSLTLLLHPYIWCMLCCSSFFGMILVATNEGVVVWYSWQRRCYVTVS